MHSSLRIKLLNKPEILFILIGLVMGIVMLFITPLFSVPDEMAHFHRAMEISNGDFYTPSDFEITEMDIKFIKTEQFEGLESFAGHPHYLSGYSFIMYVFSAIGVKLAWFISDNPYFAFYTARFFNLFMWLAMIYLAIKITPVFKWQFLIFALLPMSVFEGMSVSADSFTIAFLFLFFACMFKMIFTNDTVMSSKDKVLYLSFSVVSAFLKGILIYPEFLILYVKDKCKLKYFITAAIFSILIIGIWVSLNLGNLPRPDNVDSEYNKYVLFHEPLRVLYYCLKSIVVSSIYYIKSFIGTLGHLEIRLNRFIYFFTFLLLSLSFIFLPENFKISKNLKIGSGIMCIAYTFSLLIIEFILWTPIGFSRIQGMQGRYFYYILPLFFLIFANQRFKFQKRSQDIYKLVSIIYIIILLSYSVFKIKTFYYG